MSFEESDEELNVVQRSVRSAIYEPDRVYRILFAVMIAFFLFIALFPLYWLGVLALTPIELIVDMGLTPRGFNLSAFADIFEQAPFHFYILNSLLLASMTTVIVLLIGSIAGYVFGRLEFPGRRVLLLGILVISYFPPAAFLLPLFNLFTGNVSVLGIQSPSLFGTPGAIVLPLSALLMPLIIYTLSTFYSQIPDGLEDASRIEGSTRIGALFRVIVPLSAPGFATAAVLTFIVVYNEFFFSFLMTDGTIDSWAPIVHGLFQYQGLRQQFFNFMAAASLIGIIPMALLVLFAQEKIVSGLTAGALKE